MAGATTSDDLRSTLRSTLTEDERIEKREFISYRLSKLPITSGCLYPMSDEMEELLQDTIASEMEEWMFNNLSSKKQYDNYFAGPSAISSKKFTTLYTKANWRADPDLELEDEKLKYKKELSKVLQSILLEKLEYGKELLSLLESIVEEELSDRIKRIDEEGGDVDIEKEKFKTEKPRMLMNLYIDIDKLGDVMDVDPLSVNVKISEFLFATTRSKEEYDNAFKGPLTPSMYMAIRSVITIYEAVDFRWKTPDERQKRKRRNQNQERLHRIQREVERRDQRERKEEELLEQEDEERRIRHRQEQTEENDNLEQELAQLARLDQERQKREQQQIDVVKSYEQEQERKKQQQEQERQRRQRKYKEEEERHTIDFTDEGDMPLGPMEQQEAARNQREREQRERKQQDRKQQEIHWIVGRFNDYSMRIAKWVEGQLDKNTEMRSGKLVWKETVKIKFVPRHAIFFTLNKGEEVMVDWFLIVLKQSLERSSYITIRNIENSDAYRFAMDKMKKKLWSVERRERAKIERKRGTSQVPIDLTHVFDYRIKF